MEMVSFQTSLFLIPVSPESYSHRGSALSWEGEKFSPDTGLEIVYQNACPLCGYTRIFLEPELARGGL